MTVLYERSSAALWRTSIGQVVLLAADSDEPPFTVTGPGAALWSMLDVPTTVDDLAVRLAHAYDAGFDEIRDSLEPLLETLVDKRAVRALAMP